MKKTKTAEELMMEITSLQAQLKEKDEEIQRKAEEILLLQRRLYGRRSEKHLPEYVDARPSLFSFLEGEESLEEEQAVLVSIIEEVHKEAKERRIVKKGEDKHITRKCRLPLDIRREDHLLEPSGIDVSLMEKIGEDVTERLMYTPAEFWIKRFIRPIYKLRDIKDNISTLLYQSPQPQNILPGCMADNTLLSQIIIDKFQYHLPEYRQIERFKALGIRLTPSTVNRWVHGIADKLYFLYKLQMEDILSCDYIQVDETTQKITDKHGKARTGYLWLVRNVIEKTIFYYYDEGSRSQEVILKLLKNYRGALQTDGYAAYSIYEGKQGVLPLGCLAHVRRKFENALVVTPEAQVILDYIALLYTIESNLREREATPGQVRDEREQKSYPILRAMEQWMLDNVSSYTPKSLMHKAISYAFSMLPRVSRYCMDGRYEIDNNSIERAVRPVTLGRKNYLFSSNNKGAEDNALFYTFVTTCKELGHEPIEWFNFALSRITDTTTEEEMKELLPKNFKR